MHRSALGKCHLPKQPGQKGVRLAVGFGFWLSSDLRLGAVRGTFNIIVMAGAGEGSGATSKEVQW